MKHLTWALAALLMALPTVHAEENPQSERVSVVQTDDGLSVTEQLDWEYASNATYDPVARFQAPAAITGISITLWQGSRVTDIPPTAIQTSAGTNGLMLYRVDLSGVQPSVQSGAQFSIVAEYAVSGSSLNLATTYNVSTLTLFVRPLDGWTVESDRVQHWAPAGHDAFHAPIQGLAANETYTIAFERAAIAAETRNMDSWLWGLGGLVLGILLIMFAVRRGWIASRATSKFDKAGAMESRALLEARRRTLLAALKELEQAHEAKQIPDDAYAPLKEEYKAQAVRAMRNLEEKKET